MKSITGELLKTLKILKESLMMLIHLNWNIV